MVQAAVVSVGRELLTGRVVDSNAAHIGRHLYRLGIPVATGATVRDHVADIARAVRRAWADGADLVVTSGGLGPSDDDRTLAGIALAWDRLLACDDAALAQVRAHYAAHGLAAPDEAGTLKMATLPIGAAPLPNRAGAAPGVWLSATPRATLSLPGVPGELADILGSDEVARLLAPLRQGWFAERRATFAARDERVLVMAMRRLGRDHRGVFLKPDPKGPEHPTMDVVAEVVDTDESRAGARAEAALAALARALGDVAPPP